MANYSKIKIWLKFQPTAPKSPIKLVSTLPPRAFRNFSLQWIYIIYNADQKYQTNKAMCKKKKTDQIILTLRDRFQYSKCIKRVTHFSCLFLIDPFCLQQHQLSNMFVPISLPTYVLCMYFQTGFQHSKKLSFRFKTHVKFHAVCFKDDFSYSSTTSQNIT